MDVVGAERGYRQWLRASYLSRQRANPAFSIRAFATKIGVSRTCLSELFLLKRHLSEKSAHKICVALRFSPEETQSFKDLVKRERNPSHTRAERKALILDEDTFQFLSDRRYLVVLNLCKLPHKKVEDLDLESRLGATKLEVSAILDRLQRLGFLKIQKGKLVRKCPKLDTQPDLSSQAIKRYHIENARFLERVVEDVPPELRELSATTMAVRTDKLPEAKKLISRFRKNLEKLMEGAHPDAVYTLAIQLFPATNAKSV